MSFPWFRLYSKIITDPIIEFLSFEDQRHFVWILCLKNDGILDHKYPQEDMLDIVVSRKLGLHGEAFRSAKTRLMESGLINSRWQPKSWDNLQFKSDSSKERVRQHRERQRKNSDTKLPKRPCNVTVTAQDSDSDSDTEIKQREKEKKEKAKIEPDPPLEKPNSPPQPKSKPNAAKKPAASVPKKKWISPDWINPSAWSDFEQHRKDIRKPMSNMARTKATNQLKGLTHEQQQSCIDTTIQARWTGLFPRGNNGNHKSTPASENQFHHDLYRKIAAEAAAEEMDGGAIRAPAPEVWDSVDTPIRRVGRGH